MGDVMRTYDILEPTDNADESLKKLTEIFAPLHTAMWVAEQSKLYNDPPYSLNVGVLAAMWMSKTMKIFIGYRDMQPAGFITGLQFRPLTHQRTIYQVDDWFVPDDDVLRDGLFDYMQQALRFMGVDELILAVPPNRVLPPLGPTWKETYTTKLVHYGKR